MRRPSAVLTLLLLALQASGLGAGVAHASVAPVAHCAGMSGHGDRAHGERTTHHAAHESVNHAGLATDRATVQPVRQSGDAPSPSAPCDMPSMPGCASAAACHVQALASDGPSLARPADSGRQAAVAAIAAPDAPPTAPELPPPRR